MLQRAQGNLQEPLLVDLGNKTISQILMLLSLGMLQKLSTVEITVATQLIGCKRGAIHLQ